MHVRKVHGLAQTGLPHLVQSTGCGQGFAPVRREGDITTCKCGVEVRWKAEGHELQPFNAQPPFQRHACMKAEPEKTPTPMKPRKKKRSGRKKPWIIFQHQVRGSGYD